MDSSSPRYSNGRTRYNRAMPGVGNTVGGGLIARLLGRLRYPQLFALLAGLFLLDFLIPDPIPFVDEVALGVLTLMLAMWKERQSEIPLAKPTEKNVTPGPKRQR